MVSQNVAEIIQKHVTLEVESIDRMYLNGYVPGLQTEGGFVHFVRKHLYASTWVTPLRRRRLSLPSQKRLSRRLRTLQSRSKWMW